MNYESFPVERGESGQNDVEHDGSDDEMENYNIDSFWGNCCAVHFFGSDILVASWLFLISSISWGLMSLDLLITESKVPSNVSIEQWCQLISAAIFTLGSIFLVEGAHPVYLAGTKAQTISRRRAAKMSFANRYFTGTDVLIAAWLFAVCALPFTVLGIYSIIIEPHNSFGYIYLSGSIVAFFAMGVWVLGGKLSFKSYICIYLPSCSKLFHISHFLFLARCLTAMPENVEANGGRGSTIIVDKICCFHNCIPDDEGKYAYSDITLGMWIFFITSAVLFPYGVVSVVMKPYEIYSWLSLITFSGFFAGSGLLLRASFPENYDSTLCGECLSGLWPVQRREDSRHLLPTTEV